MQNTQEKLFASHRKANTLKIKVGNITWEAGFFNDNERGQLICIIRDGFGYGFVAIGIATLNPNDYSMPNNKEGMKAALTYALANIEDKEIRASFWEMFHARFGIVNP